MTSWTLGTIVLVMGGQVSFAAAPPPGAHAGAACGTRIRRERPPDPLREDASLGFIILECEEWEITLDSGGYSDVWHLKPVDGWHCVDGQHEVLSGEWAAAIYYDGIPNSGADPTAPPGTAVWLTPSFLGPTWTTNSSFAEVSHTAWDNQKNPASPGPWSDTGQSVITNGEVTIQIDYEIADLGSVFASPLGMKPGPETGQFALSSRYVLLQTYTITNVSARSLSNVEFYQMLHGHPGNEFGAVVNTVYDSAPYPDPLLAAYNPFDPVHTLGSFRYDITQWNNMAAPGASANWVDWISFSSTEEPTAVGNNFFVGQVDLKPPHPGAHWDVEARALNGLTALYGEVAGVEMWTLGTLNPDDSVSVTVVLMSGQVDCNENTIPDLCDIDTGSSCDGNGNGVPDECDVPFEDCNDNGFPDQCDVDSGSSDDCNGNGVPDECDGPFEDCNGNGIRDQCEPDCNTSEAPDDCDIADGTSQDIDGNGIPDECQMDPPRLPGPPHDAAKHRYISIDATRSLPGPVAIKVEIAEMLRCKYDKRRSCLDGEDCPTVCEDDRDIFSCGDGTICNDGAGGNCIPSGPCRPHPDVGLSWYVQEPQTRGADCPNGMCNEDDWYARVARLEHHVPYLYTSDWRDECNDSNWTGGCTTLHIGDCEIVPGVTYHVYACDPVAPDVCSVQLPVGTTRKPELMPHYGDVAGAVTAQNPCCFTPPDGYTSVIDIGAYLFTNENWGTTNTPQAHPTWIDLHGPGTGIPPQYIIMVTDLNMILRAFVDMSPFENTIGGLPPGDCP